MWTEVVQNRMSEDSESSDPHNVWFFALFFRLDSDMAFLQCIYYSHVNIIA
jgi:hypothetical protein